MTEYLNFRPFNVAWRHPWTDRRSSIKSLTTIHMQLVATDANWYLKITSQIECNKWVIGLRVCLLYILRVAQCRHRCLSSWWERGPAARRTHSLHAFTLIEWRSISWPITESQSYLSHPQQRQNKWKNILCIRQLCLYSFIPGGRSSWS